jgi:hypothetical protein
MFHAQSSRLLKHGMRHGACGVILKNNITSREDKKNICVVMLELSCHKDRNENFRFRIVKKLFRFVFSQKFSRTFLYENNGNINDVGYLGNGTLD